MDKKINLAKITIVIISIMILTIQVTANFNIVKSPEIMIGEKRGQNVYAIRVYPFNYGSEMNFYGGTLTNETFFAAYFMSTIKPNTFYKYSIDIDLNETGESLLTGTGTVIPSNLVYFTVADNRVFANVDSSKIGKTQGINSAYELNLIDDDYYTMFYDANNKQLSVIFYLPETYISEHPELLYHSYLYTSVGTYTGEASAKLIVSEYTGAEIQGDYTAILKQIASKLETISSTSGGITEEQMQKAITEALETEHQQAHQGATGGIDDVAGALEGVTADMEEVSEKIEEFIRTFAYQGTSAVITFPALDVPVLGRISDAITFDMAQQATEMIPGALLLMLRVATSLGLVLYPVWQTIKLFKELFT